MHLVIGDLHLTNDANDKYTQIFDNLVYRIHRINDVYFKGASRVNKITFLGDIMDCEYITYLKVVYFNDMMNYVKNIFNDVECIRIIIGNHDKYSMVDNEKNNILKYFHSDVVSQPLIDNNVLYLPHFYDKNNLDLSLLQGNNIQIVLSHAGTKDVFGEKELTVEDLERHFGKNVLIVSGHLHTVRMNYEKGCFLIGSMKGSSFNDTNFNCYACLFDEDSFETFFLPVPYYKVYRVISGKDENDIRNDIENTLKEFIDVNTNIRLYDKNGDVVFEEKIPEENFFSKIMNIRFEIDGHSVKPQNVSAILEMVRRDFFECVSLPSVKINTVFSLSKSKETQENLEISVDMEKMLIKTNEVLPKLKDFFVQVKEQSSDKSKKMKKYIDSVSDEELNSFARYLAYMDFESSFEELNTVLF